MTLVELMIVVAIIGIVASIAVPNFIKFQARSKQSEARMNLKSLYSAETSYFGDKDRFTSAFGDAGFRPERGNRYSYQIESCATYQERTSAIASVVGVDVSCVFADQHKFGTSYAGDQATLISGHTTPTWTASKTGQASVGGISDFVQGNPRNLDSWVALAAGNVDSDSFVDVWVISTATGALLAGKCNEPDYQGPATPIAPYNDATCD